jgi:dihydrofolate reductase
VSDPIRVTFVVAVAENGVIGNQGMLPWKLPSDLKRFRQLTLERPIVMGRKTYDSIGRPLDRRDNIVVTRRRDFAPPHIHVAASVEDALRLGRKLAHARHAAEIAVIGGAEIFGAALPQADRVYLTLVHASPPGDTYWHQLDPAQWTEVAREPMVQSANDQYAADFLVLERKH